MSTQTPTPFESLSDEQKAVAIAKDVIKHLDSLQVTSGSYVRGRFLLPVEFEDDSQLQPVVDKLEQSCQVCALGACFLSHVRLFNEVTLADTDNSVRDTWGIRRTSVEFAMDVSETKGPLSDYFDEGDLQLIEAAFERDDYYASDFDGVYAFAAELFGTRYTDSRERLRAIMENVIEYNGHFVLPTELLHQAREILSNEPEDEDEDE